MKQYILPIALTLAAGMYACKKDGTTTTITNTTRDTTITTSYATGLVNADSLTAGLKVAYGTNVAGTFPATSADAGAPLLDTLYQATYSVIRGRYLYIYPRAISGHISGYYVQIKGASSYFKVDYTQAYGLRKQAVTGFRSDVEGYVDSAIVIKLPQQIKGDTFYVKYTAYDDQHRVSAPVSAGVLVLPGNNTFTDALSGNWKLYGMKLYENGKFQTDTFITYPTYTEEDFKYYLCEDNKLSTTSSTSDIRLPSYKYSQADVITFSGYSMMDTIRRFNQQLNLTASSCTKIVYDTTLHEKSPSFNAAYVYDGATKSLTLVLDISNMTMQTVTYHVEELTATTFVMSTSTNANKDPKGSTTFVKFIRE